MSAVEVGLVIAAGGLCVAAIQMAFAVLTERRRTQPIVIAHEVEPRGFGRSSSTDWRVLAKITNEGTGPAFNVRFGVAYFGVRYAFRMHDDDPLSGNRQRVLQPRMSIPPDGAWPIAVSSGEMWAGEGVPEESEHYYWARYSNPQGHVWETRNSPDRSSDLDIRRVRFVRLRERIETHRRERFMAESKEFERQMLSDLREGLEVDDDDTGHGGTD